MSAAHANGVAQRFAWIHEERTAESVVVVIENVREVCVDVLYSEVASLVYGGLIGVDVIKFAQQEGLGSWTKENGVVCARALRRGERFRRLENGNHFIERHLLG